MAKKIVFLSYYDHQRRFFAWLWAHLPAGVTSENLQIYRLSATPGFLMRFLVAAAGGGNAPVDEICDFSFRKYLVRHPGLSSVRIALLRGFQHAKARAYYGWFRHALAGRCDLLVVWNGAQLPLAAAVAAARNLGIRLMFCENGYLPKTVVMDPDGVNAKNSLMGKPADFYRAVAPEPEMLAEIYRTPILARPLKGVAGAAVTEEHVDLPERFVFLPLQVHDDSQILLHSPRFSDMPSVVAAVAGAVAAQQDDLKLVVKEHPSDYGRIDYSALRRSRPDLIFTQTFSTRELIARSAAVVTVNSTVGIEALLARKPVVTLGEAFYNVPGVVRPLATGETLADALAAALSAPPDTALIDRFLYYLRYRYLVPVDRKATEASDPAPAVRRLLDAVS